MAQEDLEKLLKEESKHRKSISKLDKIIKICKGDISLHSINRECEKEKETLNKELQQLIDYSTCEHKTTKEEVDGWDSHKDYYSVKCTSCGKTIREYSI